MVQFAPRENRENDLRHGNTLGGTLVILAIALTAPRALAQSSRDGYSGDFPSHWELMIEVLDDAESPVPSMLLEVANTASSDSPRAVWTDADGKVRLTMTNVPAVVEDLSSVPTLPPSGEYLLNTTISISAASASGAQSFGHQEVVLPTVYRPLLSGIVPDPDEANEVIGAIVGSGIYAVTMYVDRLDNFPGARINALHPDPGSIPVDFVEPPSKSAEKQPDIPFEVILGGALLAAITTFAVRRFTCKDSTA